MTRQKRPKLGAVLRGTSPTSPTAEPQAEQAHEPTTAVVSGKMVQLNVAVPEELRREVRIRALQQGVDVSAIVRQLLQDWLKDT